MNFIEKIAKTIESQRLIETGRSVLVGLSGGADSVALLYALCELSEQGKKFSVSAAHLNHQSRGAESDADQDFSAALCKRLKVPFFNSRVDISALAKKDKISFEMEGRKARLAFFRRVIRKEKMYALCLAHHGDDQVENFLLRLMRGSGMDGLSGMRYDDIINDIHIKRPMLDCSHQEITDYLRAQNIEWREDPSNQDTKFKRNAVRQSVIPLLEKELNPSAKDAILRTMDIMREENKWLDDRAHTALKTVSVNKSNTLLSERMNPYSIALKRRMFRLWLRQHGVTETAITFDLVERVIELAKKSDGTRTVSINKTHQVINQYGKLRLQPISPTANEPFSVELEPGAELWIPSVELNVHVSASLGWAPLGENPRPNEYPLSATLSAQKLLGKKIVMRSINPGDRMAPRGFNGTKKLQDILVDLKVPKDERNQLPVFCCDDEIIWLPGYRIACGWGVEKDEPSVTVGLARTRKG